METISPNFFQSCVLISILRELIVSMKKHLGWQTVHEKKSNDSWPNSDQGIIEGTTCPTFTPLF